MPVEKLICIDPSEDQWEIMWAELIKLEGSATSENNGEVWQYMGSKIEGQEITHTFRHRSHPLTKDYQYRKITMPKND
jgi:hypothetical protein